MKTTTKPLPPTAAFGIQASIVVSFLAGAAAPTPLYASYQRQWHFTPIVTTVVFGAYAIAVLLALLVVGALSDYVGRRPVILASIMLQIAATLIFVSAAGVPDLLTGRLVQGLATGTAVGAVGAGMIDLDRARGTLANAVTPAAGTALGALGSGLLVSFAPQPTHLVYIILLAVYLAQGAGVLAIAETARRKPGAWASLRVRWTVPHAARTPLLRAAPVIVAVWALAGFYGALGPALAHRVVGGGALIGGLALFTLTASGAVTVLLIRTAAPRTTMRVGTVSLLAGVAVTLIALPLSSAPVFFVGTAVSGIGFGAGFQGGIRTIMPLAQPHERSGLLSVVYAISYLGFGLPTVAAGIIVVYGGGVATAAYEYGSAIMLLAVLALAGTFAADPTPPQAGLEEPARNATV